jgi:hypothetical protein
LDIYIQTRAHWIFFLETRACKKKILDLGDAFLEVTRTRGAHCRFSYLRRIFKERLLQQLESENEHGDLGVAEVTGPGCPHIFAIPGGDHALH